MKKNYSIQHKIFFLFLGVLIVSIALLGYFGFKQTSQSYINSTLTFTKSNTNNLTLLLEEDLNKIPLDTTFLSNIYTLKNFFIWKSIGEKEEERKWQTLFADSVIEFMETKKAYYKIRILDTTGTELFTTQYDKTKDKAFNTPKNLLQNKSSIFYYEKIKNLKEGEFYVSEINLNEENGKIETPYIPVIRFATPIYNNNGEKNGTLVITAFADKFISFINNNKSDVNYYLINTKGNYLYHKNEALLWAEQLNHTANIKNQYSQLLELLKEKDNDVFEIDNKLIGYKKVHPYDNDENNFWYLISEIDSDIAFVGLQQVKTTFMVVTGLILCITYFILNYFITKLVTPLSKVSRQLNALSQGEIKKETFFYKSNDEIGILIASSNILIDSFQQTIEQAKAIANGDFSKKIKLLGENDQLGLTLTHMTERLQEVATLASQISMGNYSVEVKAKSDQDELGYALVNMINYLKEITQLAESIAVGKIGANYNIKNENDRLGIAIESMNRYLNNILLQANTLANDDFSYKPEPKSKEDELGLSLLVMSDKLEENSIKNKNEAWFNKGIGIFSDELRNQDTIEALSSYAIALSAKYANAASAVFYIFNQEDETLTFQSSYAFIDNQEHKSFKLKEGIIGEVGHSRKPILLQYFDSNHYKIETGTTSVLPKETYTLPLVYEKNLLGVIEFASLSEWSKLQKDYLLKITNIMASMLHSSLQNLKIKVLLEKSQRAFEELQVNSEELQSTNTQMEIQSEQLMEQSRSLKEQNEALEKAKEEIDKKAKDLKLSNEYKSEFLANMSHELRTPLNSIILLSSLFERNTNKNLSEDDLKKANVINQSGNELLRLINDILDLSKIEAGKMELMIDTISPKTFLENFYEIFHHSAKDKNLTFKIKDSFNADFYADSARLSQIVRNLISNALKFTKSGEIVLEISKNDDVNLPIKVTLSDTGIGIPQDKQEHVFKAFSQVDGSTSREYGGTGLGLSICTQLINLMQGKIKLYSQVNEGSTFTLLLPNAKNSLAMEKKNNGYDKPVIETKDEISTQQKNFLIIEDDVNFSEILQNLLVEYNAQVHIAHNGKDGLDFASTIQFDGIFIDLGLPDMDGSEVIKALRKNTFTKHIPLQIISGIASDEFNLEEFNVIDFLQKPVTHEQLQKAIHSFYNVHLNPPHSVLIIEDNELHQQAINSYLKDFLNVDIQNVSTVQEAIKMLEKQPFDLAIVDLKLTDGSGSEVCRYIKDNNINTSTIIYTGRELSLEETEVLSLISNEIIIKNSHSSIRLKDELKRFLDYSSQPKNNIPIPKPINLSSLNIENLHNKKVLIVDDDMKNIFVLSTTLKESNMLTVHAKNGKEALEILQKVNDVDIVLMDIMMPIMNGYEAIKAIRKDEKLMHLPIIAITAKAMQKDKEKAIQCGADDYLTKPIELEKLINMISIWLNKNR